MSLYEILSLMAAFGFGDLFKRLFKRWIVALLAFLEKRRKRKEKRRKRK